jgi:hypothetical protein
MSRYLMNAAVIPHGCTGTFTYRLATVAELIAFVQAGEVINTIIYPDTLAWLQQVTGQRFKLPGERSLVQTLRPGDEAFVIRRVSRREQDWKLPFDPAVMELGLLRCEAPPPVKPMHKRGEKRAVIRQSRTRKRT